MGKSSYSQNVMLVVMPTGQPGRRRDNLVAVVITGSRRENRVAGSASDQPGRRRVNRDVENTYNQDTVVLVEMQTGQPGRGRVTRVAVGKTGSR